MVINIFVVCAEVISGGIYPTNNVWTELRECRKNPAIITSALYQKRYPQIATMLNEPALDFVWRNVFYRCGRDFSGNRAALDQLANGVFPDQNPGFVDAARGNFHVKPGAPLFNTVGFRPIPIDEIGLYPDRWRASSPKGTPVMDDQPQRRRTLPAQATVD